MRHSIGALIIKDDKILIFYHKNLNLWSIPVGKVEEDETLEDALKREMQEELDINILKCKYVNSKEYPFVTLHNFLVVVYEGTIKNSEPEKHSHLRYISFNELIEERGRLSGATKMFIEANRTGLLMKTSITSGDIGNKNEINVR